MNDFYGRADERREFEALLQRKSASLVTCQGRRRIGKSSFIKECAQKADAFLSFSGLAPREGITKQEQLDAFSEQLAKQTKIPKVKLDGWPSAFSLLASQLPAKGKVVVLLDEISWMAMGDKDFSGHLKNAWDDDFSKRKGLIIVLCGSVSSWIEHNILNNTGFVGRCTWKFHLKALPLADCVGFWGKRAARTSAAEMWRIFAVTGGVPGYLEQIFPAHSAEENIARLCFHTGGMLFHECERIFHDIFSRKAETYRDVVSALIHGPRTVQEISKTLKRERGGSLSDALYDLELAGFVRKESYFDPSTGETKSREHHFRLSDNYLRFYLKYVAPAKKRIEKGLYKRVPLESLEAWDSIMGLQFESLLLDNLEEIFSRLGLKQRTILNAAPYSQRKTLRRDACQVDLLIRTKQVIYIVEMKFRKKTGKEVITEVQEKVSRLKLPPAQSVRTVLIYSGELDAAVDESDYFDFIIPADELVKGER